VKLPNGDRAYIPREKIERYLLAPEHPAGGAKARFFLNVGFDAERPDDLISALRQIARNGLVAETIHTSHGIKYAVDGMVTTPSDRCVRLRTIWIRNPDSYRPRFVTAYPQ